MKEAHLKSNSGAVLFGQSPLYNVLWGYFIPRDKRQATRWKHDSNGQGDFHGTRNHVSGIVVKIPNSKLDKMQIFQLLWR